MAWVKESALAHSTAGIPKREVIVGLSPAESLRRGQHGGLGLLVVLSNLAVLAPAGLRLALGTVVPSVLSLVLHLEDVVEAFGGSLALLSLSFGSSNTFRALEVIDVGVGLVK